MTQPALFAAPAEHDPGCKRLIKLPLDVMVNAIWGGANREYRYLLELVWRQDLPLMMLMGMNPSGAGLDYLDMTVNKSRQIAEYNGFGGLLMVNAGAYRMTRPREMRGLKDPVGLVNHQIILQHSKRAEMIVIAAGRLADTLRESFGLIVDALLRDRRVLYALRVLEDGVPSHPLARGKGFIPVQTEPVIWKGAEHLMFDGVSKEQTDKILSFLGESGGEPVTIEDISNATGIRRQRLGLAMSQLASNSSLGIEQRGRQFWLKATHLLRVRTEASR